ncbi:hypothetical protein FA15DRAFT_700742 [Coprinopsis marcescibilis]|uniref:Uncharacterized protein n=1 Tax=Coprinopsis marcescibilis TaxID=230819 RepID=A0A5C3LJQ7_COPMA|nr:hypothetical protein FA15DRAFT_700742 [Coprinopsis marcescibilis]
MERKPYNALGTTSSDVSVGAAQFPGFPASLDPAYNPQTVHRSESLYMSQGSAFPASRPSRMSMSSPSTNQPLSTQLYPVHLQGFSPTTGHGGPPPGAQQPYYASHTQFQNTMHTNRVQNSSMQSSQPAGYVQQRPNPQRRPSAQATPFYYNQPDAGGTRHYQRPSIDQGYRYQSQGQFAPPHQRHESLQFSNPQPTPEAPPHTYRQATVPISPFQPLEPFEEIGHERQNIINTSPGSIESPLPVEAPRPVVPVAHSQFEGYDHDRDLGQAPSTEATQHSPEPANSDAVRSPEEEEEEQLAKALALSQAETVNSNHRREPSDGDDELAMILALSQSEDMARKNLQDQLRKQEEDDLERALAESMLSTATDFYGSTNPFDFADPAEAASSSRFTLDAPAPSKSPSDDDQFSVPKTELEASGPTATSHDEWESLDRVESPSLKDEIKSPVARGKMPAHTNYNPLASTIPDDDSELPQYQYDTASANSASGKGKTAERPWLVEEEPEKVSTRNQADGHNPIQVGTDHWKEDAIPQSRSSSPDDEEPLAVWFYQDGVDTLPSVDNGSATYTSARRPDSPSELPYYNDDGPPSAVETPTRQTAYYDRTETPVNQFEVDSYPPNASSPPPTTTSSATSASDSQSIQDNNEVALNLSQSQSPPPFATHSSPSLSPVSSSPVASIGNSGYFTSSTQANDNAPPAFSANSPAYQTTSTSNSPVPATASPPSLLSNVSSDYHTPSAFSSNQRPSSNSNSQLPIPQSSTSVSNSPNVNTVPLTNFDPLPSLTRISSSTSSTSGFQSEPPFAQTQAVNANQFIDPELLMGVSIGFTQPALSPRLQPMESAVPNIISLPYGRCPALHIQAPSWRHLLKLMARMSATKFEPTVQAMAITKTELKLRTVIQFVKPSPSSPEWRTILWFKIDHPVPPNVANGQKYQNAHTNVLPYAFTLMTLPLVLQNAADSPISKTYTVPATESLPYPTLPISFPNLALYLQAVLDFSRQQKDDNNGLRKLSKMVQTCNPQSEEESSLEPPDKATVADLFKRVMGRDKRKQKGKTNNETYDLITPFVPDEWG